MKKWKCKKRSFFYQALINISYVDIMLISGYCPLEWPTFTFPRSSSYQLRPQFIKMVKHVPNLIDLSTDVQIFEELGIFAISQSNNNKPQQTNKTKQKAKPKPNLKQRPKNSHPNPKHSLDFYFPSWMNLY